MKALIFLFLFLCTRFTFSCEAQNSIDWSQKSRKESIYSQLNDAGIDLFVSAHYKEALEKFKNVLGDYQKYEVTELELGTALLGKTFCDAALENMNDLYEDVAAVEYFFLDYHGCNHAKNTVTHRSESIKYVPYIQVVNNNRKWFNRPPGQIAADVGVQLADPDEKITIQDCVERVKGTATVLKAAVACLKRGEVAWILNTMISKIENACINCCNNGNFWTACVSPMLARLNKWVKFGVPDDPAWD